MNPLAQLTNGNPGFGLGLRTPHYPDFLRQHQPLDWLEVITDNFLVEGGRPLRMLETLRRDYPVALHGVAMSLGSADGLNLAYLHQVKQLAQRVEPLWVSDHLCWSGMGTTVLHDLNPLPYTEEAARRLIMHISQAQEVLQRRLVVENVSSYVTFAHSAATEWDFLAHVAQEADCLLLVDINNIFVSSVNHGFDPLDYLRALPAHRVQQIHLAGHSRYPGHIIDTHDQPVCELVWQLYGAACRQFGAVATMIERDDNIPPLAELLIELDQARAIAQAHTGVAEGAKPYQPYGQAPKVKKHSALTLKALPALKHLSRVVQPKPWRSVGTETGTGAGADLAELQSAWIDCVLQDPMPHDAQARLGLAQSISVNAVTAATDAPSERFDIYHRAYRLRLCEVLSDSFAKTCAYLGQDLFNELASRFAVQQPPQGRSLGRYGSTLPLFFLRTYPDNRELQELAQLDWDLRTRFDGKDAPALGTDALMPSAKGEVPCLVLAAPLHPSVLLRDSHTNAIKLWRAIDNDTDVPEVQHHGPGEGLVVWRWELQPHFMRLDTAQYRFMQALAAGSSIQDTAQHWADTGLLHSPELLGQWLQTWLAQGLLRSP